MSTDATINLQDLQCLRQDRGSDGSDPYIWPALVSIDSSLRVNVLTPYNESRVIIQSGMTNGQTAAIPAIVGAQTTRLEGDLTANHLILVVALWERRDTPDNVVSAGYSAFSDSLGTGIRANLLGLGSSDPATQQAAIDAVKTTVKNGVTDAISNSLTWYQKAEIAAGVMHLDDLIDNSSTAFSSLTPQTFAVSFGGSIGGRLLFYRDNTQNGTGDVDTPGTIGQGGWEEFKFLFSGGNGIIYAVNQQGQLLFYRDNTQNGTGDVDTPSVIGLGGWADFKFLFSGGNGIIYAVNQQGQLLFYRDNTQNGTGDVDTPSVIGLGGWADFKFLFSGGNGIIYAVNQQGQLLFYRDNTQNGTGDVDTPSVIGLGGWADFKFLFSGGNGIIYAVNQQGQLLFYRDNTQNGTGDVDTPSVIGLGGWTDFQFLFSGGNGIIYASEPALTPANSYVVDANLQLATVVCEAESLAVNQDQVAVNGLKAQLQELQKEFAQAPASEKPGILADIREFEKDELAPAEAKLAADTRALEACRARSGVPTSKKTAASAESPAVNRVTVPV